MQYQVCNCKGRGKQVASRLPLWPRSPTGRRSPLPPGLCPLGPTTLYGPGGGRRPKRFFFFFFFFFVGWVVKQHQTAPKGTISQAACCNLKIKNRKYLSLICAWCRWLHLCQFMSYTYAYWKSYCRVLDVIDVQV